MIYAAKPDMTTGDESQRPFETITPLAARLSLKPGEKKKKSLVIRGWQRAGSWSALLGAGLAGDDFPRPAVIYAAKPDMTTGDESQRPFETITPLAARLSLKPA